MTAAIERFIDEIPLEDIPSHFISRVAFSRFGQDFVLTGADAMRFRDDKPSGVYNVAYYVDKRRVAKVIALEAYYIMAKVDLLIGFEHDR